MKIIPMDTDDRRQVQRFLALPFRLYRDCPQWVPPLEIDARLVFDRRRYPFYKHSDAAFFLAEDDAGQVIGRIAVLENRNHNAFNHEKTAFFYLFECENQRDAALGLFEAAFDWARQRGLEQIKGPKGFSPFDGMGLLVKGFEHRPAFGIPYNLPYYAELIEAAGFVGCENIVSGYLDASMAFPEKIHQVAERVRQRRGLVVAPCRTKAQLRALAPRLKELYNSSLAGTYGNVPVTDAELQRLIEQLLWFADPRLIKIVFKGEEPVGFLLAYPDVSAALQRTRGKIFPFGWIDLLLELKRTKWVNLNGAAIVEKYRGLGGTALLFSEMQKSVVEGGFQHADLVQVSQDNDKMQLELRDLGVDFYKMHRMYRRGL